MSKSYVLNVENKKVSEVKIYIKNSSGVFCDRQKIYNGNFSYEYFITPSLQKVIKKLIKNLGE